MAKNQLEKISRLDFEKPTDHLKRLANKFGYTIEIVKKLISFIELTFQIHQLKMN